MIIRQSIMIMSHHALFAKQQKQVNSKCKQKRVSKGFWSPKTVQAVHEKETSSEKSKLSNVAATIYKDKYLNYIFNFKSLIVKN